MLVPTYSALYGLLRAGRPAKMARAQQHLGIEINSAANIYP
jgi:hypothetical protein